MPREVLVIATWKVKTLVDNARQAITAYTFSKYRVDIVRAITKPRSEQTVLYYCSVSDN